MSYDEQLAERVRARLARKRSVVEKKMFGGLVFLLQGNILVGIWRDSLIARIGQEMADAALRESHVRPMDITGKPMTGWIIIDSAGIEDDESLTRWIEIARSFVVTLPKKNA